MGPYSHYFLAARLEPLLNPENRPAYYWGAVAPDIRYLARMQRAQTHLEQDRLKEFMTSYPHLRSFLTGYQVHLLIDQVDLSLVVGAAFPLNLIMALRRNGLSHRQMTMAVEMYYLQSGAVGEPLEGAYNEVFADLGISAEQARQFHQALQVYFAARSSEAAISAFQKIGMIENSRIEKYMAAYRTMQTRKALYGLFLIGIKNARLDSKVMEHVRANMSNR